MNCNNNMELYRNSSVGLALIETLNSLLEDGAIESEGANHILVEVEFCCKYYHNYFVIKL